jgi:hypothetical protein
MMKPIRFIGEEIEVIYDKPPTLAKKPGCPDGFIWENNTFRITALLSEWNDFTRRGRFSRNMQPQNQRKAVRRGSFGVGRYYYQVRTNQNRIFELYYDRAPKSIDDKSGSWNLFRELERAEK